MRDQSELRDLREFAVEAAKEPTHVTEAAEWAQVCIELVDQLFEEDTLHSQQQDRWLDAEGELREQLKAARDEARRLNGGIDPQHGTHERFRVDL